MEENITISIFKTHLKRLGLSRVLIGSFSMYVTFPLFLMIHITITIFCYKLFLRPLLNLSVIDPKRYIILDRFNMPGLGWLDRFNCLFCDYANGVTKLFHDEIDCIANDNKKHSSIKIILIYVAVIPLTLFFGLGIVITSIPTKFVVSALGFHRASVRRIKKEIVDDSYANQYPVFIKKVVRFYKLNAKILSFNLEQIESAWCPIRHLEREGYVFTRQHNNFISRTELEKVEKLLREKGTVSEKLPKIKPKGVGEQN